MFALEGEIVVARETFDFDEAGVFVEYSEWNVAPQANLRWQYNFHGSVAPYASIGVGPTFAFYDADTSIGDFSADDVLFSYNGRAGLEFAISERVGIEGGYRYFGFTDAGTAGFHAGEVGLNFKF
jgi:opacity protein-like surface antigen